jgi:hypothetical protein
MGWREVVSDLVPEIAEGWLCSSDVQEALLRMDEPDRLALARELLPAGSVVAREVGEARMEGVFDYDHGRMDGWNACRAAMMGEGE